jgi:hypothetical protein
MLDISLKAFLMETYVPELDQAAATHTAASRSAATAELRARGAAIELLHSFAVLGEETCFSLFSAATLADVHTAGELARVGHDHLVEVICYRQD